MSTQIRSAQIRDAAIDAAKLAAILDLTGKTVSVAAPTADSHAATRKYVTDSVAALGNVFNYINTIEGGADVPGAVDLALLAADAKNAGDYYKVSTAGYFKVGAGAEFFANINDGLVWNTSGGVDVIDNTNSSVTGVADETTVTGSADTGFVVGLNTTFKNRVGQLETDRGTMASLTTTEKTNLVGAINEVNAKSAGSSYTRETPAGDVDGVNAAFALSVAPYLGTVQVYINGLLQEEGAGEDYTISGQTVTFNAAPLTGDKVRVIYFKA